MADTKITALAAITTVDPAADVLPIVDVSDTSMAASGTTKKITSNQILGAGGTATLASATITGDLTVRTNKLAVTSSGVGFGTTSPSAPIQVGDTTGSPEIRMSGASTAAAGPYLTFYKGGTRKTLIGNEAVLIGSGTSDALMFYTEGGNGIKWNIGSSTPSMTLDSSGNLGLGVTPSAGGSNYYKTFELGKAGCGLFVATNILTSSELTYLSGNGVLKYNSSPEWSYGNAGSAAIYGIEDGVHKWYNAGSGSAGGVFVPTQAMTLDASGRLLVGVTSANASGGTLQLASGITFPATQVASSDANTLDDYEEGTWTGTLTGSVSNPTTPVTATGRYTKVGRQVFVEIAFEAVDTTGASGSIQVTGLPFQPQAFRAVGTAGSYSGATFTGYMIAEIPALNSTIEFMSIISNTAWNAATHNAGTTRYFWASVTYTV